MTATATRTPPKPALAAAPAPAPCPGCQREPQPCLLCYRTGRDAVRFDLGGTHSYAVRRAVFRQVSPALADLPAGTFLGYLWVTTAKTPKSRATERLYRVRQFECDFEGFAFEVVKAGEAVGYRVLLPACGGATCDCKGHSYEATGKANYRAHLSDGVQAVSAGCVHCDAILCLARSGWMEHAQEDC